MLYDSMLEIYTCKMTKSESIGRAMVFKNQK